VFQKSGISISGKWFFTSILTAMVLVLSGAGSAASDNDDIIRRIAPVGTVCVAGDSCAGGATLASAGNGAGPEDPEQIYNTYCIACHGSGANNSPIRGDAVAWQPRLEKGVETLYQSALNGFNNGAMPPKGLCMNCSEDAVKATVDYIISAVQ
jgi:cytochrome c5